MIQEASFSFFPGCLIRSRLPHLEKSARVVLEKFHVTLSELKEATCCPNPIYFRDLDQETWLTLAARNLSLLAGDGRPMMTLCSGCYNTFRECEHTLAANQRLREEITQNLENIGREYVPDNGVEHIAPFLYEKIGPDRLATQVTRPLNGMKVAFHHGCHFVRPSHLHRFDDPDHPTKMEALIRALGADVVDFPRKMLCCGLTVMGVDPDLSQQMGFEKLRLMKAEGAEAVVLACPSCMLQFDHNQRLIEGKFDTKLSLPVFFLTEIIGLALGESPETLGLEQHRVDVLPLVRRLPLQGEKKTAKRWRLNPNTLLQE